MKARTFVIGGGLIGISTLYELTARGVPATLLEAGEGVALEASHANAGLLTPSMSDPWNSPGVWRHILSSLFDPYAAMKLRWHALPGLTFWGLKFLRHSTPALYRQATNSVFRLARYSTQQTEELARKLRIDFGLLDNGALKVFESAAALAVACSHAERMQPQGLRYERLTVDGVVKIEPGLEPVSDRLVGGLLYPDDRCGDARLFTEALASAACRNGAQVRTGVAVDRLVIEGGAVTGIRTSYGLESANCVIICAGNASARLARQAGVRLAIKPVKGYSVTFKLKDGILGPSLPVIDDAMHAAVVPLGDSLRVAGTAEFAGFDTSLSAERVENLLMLFKRLYPRLEHQIDRQTLKPWTHFRPMSADALPFIGQAGPEGLFINAGHGYLGWTMATGAASLLADLMEGRSPAIDPSPYQVIR